MESDVRRRAHGVSLTKSLTWLASLATLSHKGRGLHRARDTNHATHRENIFDRPIRAAHLNAHLMPCEGTLKITLRR
jgi:hypothetical protein